MEQISLLLISTYVLLMCVSVHFKVLWGGVVGRGGREGGVVGRGGGEGGVGGRCGGEVWWGGVGGRYGGEGW